MRAFPLCLLSLCTTIASAQDPTRLSVLSVDDAIGYIDIGMNNDQPVAGFQFTVLDELGNPVPVISGLGGSAGAQGFNVGTNPSTGIVLGFSFSLTTIPPSGGAHPLLTRLFFTPPSTGVVCITSEVISDASGNALPTEVGPCVDVPIIDCNINGIADPTELYQGVALDLDADGTLDECQPFQASSGSLSLSQGGSQDWTLTAGSAFGGGLYIVLGSTSGTTPGIQIDSALIPLNIDAYFLLTLSNANSGPFSQTLGLLDGSGGASAAFVLPSGVDPALAGLGLQHAFIAIAPGQLGIGFASNAMPLALEL